MSISDSFDRDRALGALALVVALWATSACAVLSLPVFVAPTPTPTATATATLTPTPLPTATATATPTATPRPSCEPSGTGWEPLFPDSQSTEDLVPAFRDEVNRFIAALRTAGAAVKVSSTYRPRERAYLMHYAYEIARNGVDPRTVPALAKVNVCWAHKDANGDYDPAASKKAAAEMVVAYNMAYAAALNSRHTERRAIDMTISWPGDLAIMDAAGKLVRIRTEPRSGSNHELQEVGAGYGVIKLVADPPHWSDDGH